MKTKTLYLTFLLALATVSTAVSQGPIVCPDCFPPGDGEIGFPECSNWPAIGILYVDQSIDTPGNGRSWPEAMKSLPAALQYANSCDKIKEIRVARGTYKPTTSATTAGRKHTFFINRGYKLTGGYPSGGGDYNPAQNPTILDGDIGGGHRSYHVLVVANISLFYPLTIDGFRIRNGAAEGTGFMEVDPLLDPVYESKGGGAYLISSDNVIFRNCAVYNNSSTTNGGAIYCDNSKVHVINSVVAGNTSHSGGGVLLDRVSSSLHAVNSTFYGNTASIGGATYGVATSIIKLSNSIVWGNSSEWGGNGTRQAEYSIIEGYSEQSPSAPTGPGNHYLDPQFLNPSDLNGADNVWFTSDDGLSLANCSPAINMGSNAAISGLSLNKDITGADRIYNMTIDAGAYEYPRLQQRPENAASLKGDNGYVFGSFGLVYGGTTIIHMNCKAIASVTPGGASPVSGKIWAHVGYGNAGTNDLPSLGSTVYAPRFFLIYPTNNADGATAEITLYFKQSDFNVYNTAVGSGHLHLPANSTDTKGKSNLLITQFHGRSDTHWYPPGTYNGPTEVFHPKNEDIVWHPGTGGSIWDPAEGYWSVTFPVNGFSGFFVSAGTETSLPVTLASFEAKPENRTVQLSWKTTTESNSSHFLVQRSADGQEFTEIGRVDAAGDSEGMRSYGFTDNIPFVHAMSPVYYRLKQVDRDGVYTFSRIVSVRMQDGPGAERIVLLGNPVSDQLRLQYRAAGYEKVIIRLRDATGRLLYDIDRQVLPGEQELSLSLQGLPAGLYLAEVSTGGERKVFKVVRQ